MTEVINDTKLCTGCSACSQICPNCAISMKEDDEGFLFPEIDQELCNECGLCQSTCPVNQALTKGSEKGLGVNHKAYACFSRDTEIRSSSSSGGAFTLLAQSVLADGGVVFGAEFDSSYRVRHGFVEEEGRLDALRRSKYVQSDTENTFKAARDFLKQGRRVLYCGTPCQVAGLKAFLKKEYGNLLTCDIACSGVPSPKVWEMYTRFLREKYKSEISSISFRDKTDGWNRCNMRVDFENGQQYVDRLKRELFFIGFGKNVFNRRSCFNCQFRLNNTGADLTLADFWGIDKQEDKDFLDNKGVSLVITNTEAGKRALEAIKERVFIKPASLETATQYNPRLLRSVAEPAGRKQFFEDMLSGYSFDRLRRKYMDNFSPKYRAKQIIKMFLGRT